MSTETPVRRWMIEGLVIVASILLAFGIDAAWDVRRESAAREALFSTYRSDIAAMRIELERVRGNHRRGRTATAEVAALRDGPQLTEDDAPRVDSLLNLAMYGSTFDAPIGAAEAIAEGGDLAYLRNPELVATSNALIALIADLEREQSELADDLNDATDVLMERGVDTADLWDYSTPADEIDVAEASSVPWPTRPSSAWTVMDSPRVRGEMAELHWQYRNCLTSLARIERALDQIERLIGPAM